MEPTPTAVETKAREWKDLVDLNLWITPLTTFVDQYIDDQFYVQPVSFISSMTLTASGLRRIKALLKTKPGHKIFMLFDTGFDISSPATKEVLDLADDQLLLMPLFNTPDENSLYHIKAATGLASNKVLWTSSNFRSNSPTQLVDVGLTFNNAEISASLTRFFMDTIDSSCRNIEYLECPISALPRHLRQSSRY